MDVPGTPGVHRVNWDLRHGLPGQPAGQPAWTAHDPTQVPRTLENRGPFVSPGVYTAELSAQGGTHSRDFQVRGDPDLPLTVEDYREREAFLLELLSLRGSLEGAPAPAERHRRALQQLYGAINGGGVRQGTLHPPTATQRRRLEEIKAALQGG